MFEVVRFCIHFLTYSGLCRMCVLAHKILVLEVFYSETISNGKQ